MNDAERLVACYERSNRRLQRARQRAIKSGDASILAEAVVDAIEESRVIEAIARETPGLPRLPAISVQELCGGNREAQARLEERLEARRARVTWH